MRIGTMLKKEIETRGIKTVNDTIIAAVISHYHTVCGVDEKLTLEFIRTVTTKYYSYVDTRQKKRKDDKFVSADAEEDDAEGDVEYDDE